MIPLKKDMTMRGRHMLNDGVYVASDDSGEIGVIKVHLGKYTLLGYHNDHGHFIRNTEQVEKDVSSLSAKLSFTKLN